MSILLLTSPSLQVCEKEVVLEEELRGGEEEFRSGEFEVGRSNQREGSK